MQTTPIPRPFDRAKFKALVHYICYKADPNKLGATRLNKILWFADMLHFTNTGLPMTGEAYVKNRFGPTPRHVLSIIEELETERALVVRHPELDHEKRLFIAPDAPPLDQFSPDEISLVDAILHSICNHFTAESISEATHDVIWQLAEIGEEIPYEAFLATDEGEVTDEDLNWAVEAAARGN
jgi:hypothetical protein